MLDSKKKSEGEVATISSATILKPRQVLLSSLSNQIMKHKVGKNGGNNGSFSSENVSLTPEDRGLLIQSICHFLERNFFAKTLKKFRKEANIEKDSWKTCQLNLEKMCYEYLRVCTTITADSKAIKEQGLCSIKEGDGDANHVTPLETVERKKKKRSDECLDKKVKDAGELAGFAKAFGENVENNVANDVNIKSKKKVPQVEGKKLEKDDHVCLEEKKDKHKSKKQKEKALVSNDSSVGAIEIIEEERQSMKENLQSPKGESDATKKELKKRKKFLSVNKENGQIEEGTKYSKSRKTDASDRLSGNGQIIKDIASSGANGQANKGENGQVDHATSQTPSRELIKGSVDEILEKDRRKNSASQSSKKQYDDSTEAKKSHAFQRVKAEEVVFADERLKDNSYWSKDGAEIGYGAKAQEVLGQVRGRNFRHEKTKKKRGSYRGGQIDLQPHSVKFSYSDEDD